jgi:hypothetical protein
VGLDPQHARFEAHSSLSRIAFTGKIDQLTIALDAPKLTAEDEKWLMQAQRKASDQ